MDSEKWAEVAPVAPPPQWPAGNFVAGTHIRRFDDSVAERLVRAGASDVFVAYAFAAIPAFASHRFDGARFGRMFR
jgi:hypothetical protein